MAIGILLPNIHVVQGRKLGCQADVLKDLDALCSGRQQCSIPYVTHKKFTKHKVCPRGYPPYLAAAFSCHKGMYENKMFEN